MARVKVVDKALQQFHNLQEWADYIAAIARLQKVLVGHESQLDELTVDVALTLARCLSSQLPLGVHQKALGVYTQIFRAMLDTSLNQEVEIWLPGLLPILGFASLGVKPVALGIIRDQIMLRLSSSSLQLVAFPLLNALMSGLEDETLELFVLFHATVESFKQLVADDRVFWQKFILVVMRSGERRMGALRWIVRHLPKLTDENDPEAKAIIGLERGGLSVRMFVAALSDNDIVVVRGFFDILLSHWPLEAVALVVSTKDLRLLVMMTAKVALRKDMSLNRRLYTYVLGDGEDKAGYFKKHALEPLIQGLTELMQVSPEKAIRILLLLAMDKWEISQLVVPVVFGQILDVFCNGSIESNCLQFFDAIDPGYLWRQLVIGPTEITKLLVDKWEFPLDRNFDVENVLAGLMFLDLPSSPETLTRLVTMCGHFDDSQPEVLGDEAPLDVTQTVLDFYTSKISDSTTPLPFTLPQLRKLLVKGAVSLYHRHPEEKYAQLVVDVCNITTTKLDADDVDLTTAPTLAVQTILSVVQPPLPATLLGHLLDEVIQEGDDYKQVPRLLDYFSKGQVEAGIFLGLSRLNSAKRYSSFSQLWIQFSHHEPEVMARPLQLVMDAVPDPNAVACLAAIFNSLRRGPLVLLLAVSPLDPSDYGRWRYLFDLVLAVVDAVPKARDVFCEGEGSSKWRMVSQVETLLSQEVLDEVDASPDPEYFDAVAAGLRVVLKLVTGLELQFSDFVTRLFSATLRLNGRGVSYEYTQAKCLDILEGILSFGVAGDTVVDFILQGLESATTKVLVEKWVAVLVRTIPTLGETLFFFAVVPFTDALIRKIDSSELIDPVFNGISDMLTISHSYFRAHQNGSKAPQTPLGNFLGKVFTIETPASELEERQRQVAIQEAVRVLVTAAVKVWNAHPHSTTIRFQVKKLLTRLLDLQRKFVLELLVMLGDNVRLVTIVDGGRQVVVPQLFDIVLTTSANKIRTTTLQFIVDYFRFAVDADSLLDIWPLTVQFLNELASLKTSLCGALRLAVELGHLNKPGTPPPGELADALVKLVNLVSQMDHQLDMVSTLAAVLPQVAKVYAGDNEKLVSTTNTVVYNVVAPELKRAKNNVAQVPATVIAIIAHLGTICPTKLWKTTTQEIFHLSLFFECPPHLWQQVIRLWIDNDGDKFAELVAKATPVTLTISLWGEGLSAETKEKIGILKRITYLLMIGDVDQFLPHFSLLFDQIEVAQSLRDKVAPEYFGALAVLTRAICLRFSELHLLPKWTTINTLILAPLRLVLAKDKLTSPEVQLILASCKLLDQLLLVGYDEFSLTEWTFVGEHGIISQISASKKLHQLGVAAITIDSTYDGKLRPLLAGVQSISSLSELRLFFDGLPIIHFERVYSMQTMDTPAVEADVYGDVFG